MCIATRSRYAKSGRRGRRPLQLALFGKRSVAPHRLLTWRAAKRPRLNFFLHTNKPRTSRLFRSATAHEHEHSMVRYNPRMNHNDQRARIDIPRASSHVRGRYKGERDLALENLSPPCVLPERESARSIRAITACRRGVEDVAPYEDSVAAEWRRGQTER